jgi:hypothetical protein
LHTSKPCKPRRFAYPSHEIEKVENVGCYSVAIFQPFDFKIDAHMRRAEVLIDSEIVERALKHVRFDGDETGQTTF